MVSARSEETEEGEWAGLSSEDAFAAIVNDIEECTRDFRLHLKQLGPSDTHDARSSWCLCPRLLLFLSVVGLAMLIGAVDIDNHVSLPCLLSACVVLLTAAANFLLREWCSLRWRKRRLRRVEKLVARLKQLDASKLTYDNRLEPVSEEMSVQRGMRDGRVCNVPRLLLARGDVILLRPGQSVPCACVDASGRQFMRGERPKREVEVEENGGVRPMREWRVVVLESPMRGHMQRVLAGDDSTVALHSQINSVLHRYAEHLFIPLILAVAIVLTFVRFYYAGPDTLFGTRFIFAVPALICLPALCPALPLAYFAIKVWNNATVVVHCDGGLVEPAWTTVARTFVKMIREEGDVAGRDLVAYLGAVTGVSAVDKKGLLAPVSPAIDKMFFFDDREEDEGTHRLAAEILDLSSELMGDGSWHVDFDDPTWRRFESNLLPIAQNIMLNSCRFNKDYHRLLDHTTSVSEVVPRTIAAANRRCACQLPPLIGFDPRALDQFSCESAFTIGAYKREPGDAPMPGLTKHRTPLETAFCSVHGDARSLHQHVACQGTAGIVLEACTHVWDGGSVRPLTRVARKAAADFYQRHSMTGYCLAVSYRPVGATLSPHLADRYVEVPLTRGGARGGGASGTAATTLPRSHSIDDVNDGEKFFKTTLVDSADGVMDEYLSGHVLCGMIAMQYQAHPDLVQLADSLEQACIRFVYFSRENELRSRIFAEKLGLEAGWNCHVSLAAEETEEGRLSRAFTATNTVRGGAWTPLLGGAKKAWERWKSHSDVFVCDAEQLVRASPASGEQRRMSRTSFHSGPKVGAMPNKARLPTGVANVRPHLDEVDNVPLLVGLFTDCTSAATAEMIRIMQENGEVVLVIGSSLNFYNDEVFTQADVSLCVEPRSWSACQYAALNGDGPLGGARGEERQAGERQTARHIAAQCMALATDLSFNHKQLCLLPSLLTRCRYRLLAVRTALLFMLQASAAVSCVQLLSALLFLPIAMRPMQMCLFCFVHVPLMSVSLVGAFAPCDNPIQISPKNKDDVTKKGVSAVGYSFLVHFLPAALFTVFVFYVLLVQNANVVCAFSDVVCSIGDHVGEAMNDSDFVVTNRHLSTDHIRHIAGFHLLVYLLVISVSSVHPLHSLWRQSPLRSARWIAAACVCLAVQTLFTLFDSSLPLWRLLSAQSLVAFPMWSVVLMCLGEARKLQTISIFSRDQRRSKFSFDTKLGMNSPY